MSPSPPPLSLSLTDPRATRREWTGEKAAPLAALGHPEPAGVVLTSVALGSWLASLDRPDDAAVLAAELPGPLLAAVAVAAAVATLGGPLAVRSRGGGVLGDAGSRRSRTSASAPRPRAGAATCCPAGTRTGGTRRIRRSCAVGSSGWWRPPRGR